MFRRGQGGVAIVDDLELGPVHHLADDGELIFEGRKEGIALHGAFHERQIQVGTQWQRLFINLRAANVITPSAQLATTT